MKHTKLQGNVFHIQRFSLFDGPGVRTVVFLKGCPLRCNWCHNPEGICGEIQLMYAGERCIGCGVCAQMCPNGAHRMQNGLHDFCREKCTGCSICARECCTRALSIAGKYMTVEEVMEEVLRDLPVYQESGGGMTLSGGEPMFQAEFAIALLKTAKTYGISTCMETCGQTSEAAIREAAKYTDDFYFDYKATGDEMHKALCGVGQTVILRNLAVLDELGGRVTLRCPIIPGQNETPEHICAIGELALRYSCISEVHLEPYHRMGISKSEKLGEIPKYDGKVPQQAEMEKYCIQISDISGKMCKIS